MYKKQKYYYYDLNKNINTYEGYVLEVSSENIKIDGKTENGVFYGIPTLRKAISAKAIEETISLPASIIKDQPHFKHRGMYLDVGRHFFPIEFIKEYINLLALHNINTFH